MEEQHLVLTLPKDLIERTKMQAAMKSLSLDEFVMVTLEEKLKRRTGFSAAKKRQLRVLSSGFDLGSAGTLDRDRENMHERG